MLTAVEEFMGWGCGCMAVKVLTEVGKVMAVEV
jgi:hypothetical protein